MKIRMAGGDDLDVICAIEVLCFSPNEAASRDSISSRLKVFPQHFWVIEDGNTVVGFVNGMVTDHDRIVDEMFVNAMLHDDGGGWQSIFGLAVLPEYRKHGYSRQIIHHLIEKATEQGRLGITLTCKEYLIAYYEKLGFYNAGLSQSVHGGETWYDMKMELPKRSI